MSEELERVHTINLGKVLLSQPQHRAVRALNMIREFARRHMKTHNIKIDEDLARQVWARGARSPPRKIRVRMYKTDTGDILVSRYDEPADVEDVGGDAAPAIESTADTAIEGATTAAIAGTTTGTPSLPEPGLDAGKDSDSDAVIDGDADTDDVDSADADLQPPEDDVQDSSTEPGHVRNGDHGGSEVAVTDEVPEAGDASAGDDDNDDGDDSDSDNNGVASDVDDSGDSAVTADGGATAAAATTTTAPGSGDDTEASPEESKQP